MLYSLKLSKDMKSTIINILSKYKFRASDYCLLLIAFFYPLLSAENASAISVESLCSSNEMTLSQKIGQLLMVSFEGQTYNRFSQELINDIGVGGFIYYEWANGLTNPTQVRKLSSDLQTCASGNRTALPLLIAVDQEGGRVTRLKEGFTSLLDNQSIANPGNPELAYQQAFVSGKELLAVGINLNLAPVVDIQSNPLCTVIGARSFGCTADEVVRYASRSIEGYRTSGILTTLKHYPGHGDVEIDSHAGLPVSHKSLSQLSECELKPFAALAQHSDAVMTAHIQFPRIDEKNCATFSSKILGYLRETLGFQGVIISDSLVMKGALQDNDTIQEVAIRALVAGCDILLVGGKKLVDKDICVSVSEIADIKQAIIDAVASGRVSEKRIQEAFERVLVLKRKISASDALRQRQSLKTGTSKSG